MYELTPAGEQLVLDWLSRVTHSVDRGAMLQFLPRLAADPHGVASAELPGHDLPVLTAWVDPPVALVTYVVADDFDPPAVLIVEISS